MVTSDETNDTARRSKCHGGGGGGGGGGGNGSEERPHTQEEIIKLIKTHENETGKAKGVIMEIVNGLKPVNKSILSTIRSIFLVIENKSKGFLSKLFGAPNLKVHINDVEDGNSRGIDQLRQYLLVQKDWIFQLQDDVKSMVMKLEGDDTKLNEKNEIIETLKKEINEKDEIIKGITQDFSIKTNKTKTLLIQLIETHKQKIITNRSNDEKFHNIFDQHILTTSTLSTSTSNPSSENKSSEEIGDMSSECFKLDSYMSSIHILINDICTASTQSDKNFQDEIIKLHNQAIEKEKITQSTIDSLQKELEDSLKKLGKELDVTKGDLQDANAMLQKAMGKETSLQDKIKQLEVSLSAAMGKETSLQDKIKQLEVSLSA
eukprot:gene6677-13523_t